ncbi:DUF4129 domain-containing protein [Mycobacterium sp. 852014-52144_SCH5372336]|uniref:DUF4129 domain-containing protein n=1 Tax=Mycobacterium sp. 852014-52144_SCH5372336 TaxID=1834115 RepID=UPI0007FCE66D|nr:DUF4129 domain-containing protein [Mycobacterium sp. 852014-52144_SCH5372336]OBB70622.1 hypothetical protein A5759_00470 [Mycobacterium sp. 852014-52144_SCH5372336]
MGTAGTSTRRVIAVIALMVLAALALRGYVPGVERTAEEPGQRQSNPLALAAVIVLLCAAVAIIGLAIIVRMRDNRPLPAPAGSLPRDRRPGDRPSWRFTLVALAALIGLVFLVLLLSRLSLPVPTEEVPPAATPDTSVRGDPDDSVSPRPDEDDAADGNVVNYLIPPILLLMALIVVGTAVASRRQGRPPTSADIVEAVDEPVVPTTTTSLARAAEVGLAEIGDLSREPREAIIACYAAMERELTRVPGAAPQAYDTPTEVLARAVASGALRSDSATELVELFEEARFSPHVMSERHRDAAVQVLNRVLSELPQRTTGVAS